MMGKGKNMKQDFLNALERAQQEKNMSIDEMMILLSAQEGEETGALFSLANKIRHKYVGEEVHLRGLLEISNYCTRNCLYCGLRLDNQPLVRYRMTEEEIIDTAYRAEHHGFKTIVLQSGEDPYYSTDMLEKMIAKIKKETDLVVTLSLGEKDREDYKRFREAGANRYLLKHEIMNPLIFKKLKPDSLWRERIQCIAWLRELGYEVGSGCMVGLPGQSLSDLAQDILFMKRMNVDMVGIGPFIPHAQTPLKDEKMGDLTLTLKAVAVSRIVLKDINMPATTAIETIHPEGRKRALEAGANVLMPNISPVENRKHYEIYPNKAALDLEEAKKLINALGRKVGQGHGNRMKRN